MEKKLENKRHIIEICNQLANHIEEKKEELINLLLEYESFETAEDEIWRSQDCLRNINKEAEDLESIKVSSICTFFPVNLPLYSLIVFALVPSFVAKNLALRPPLLMTKIIKDIIKVLSIDQSFSNVQLVEMDRATFREVYISSADVVLFTGKYENAMVVRADCPNALFIYNGAGVNPVVITENADLDLAVEKTVEMRAFNSGQDCAGSDAILIHESIKNNFFKKLIEKVSKIKVGDYKNKENKVGKIVKQDELGGVEVFFNQHRANIVFGGKIDFENGIVSPTIIFEELSKIENLDFKEFFSPVFYCLAYENENDLKKYFEHIYYQQHAMYVSLFGQSRYVESLKNSIVLNNKIVNDVERGNDPYGGYGEKANFVLYKSKKYPRPLLISREIANFLKNTKVDFRNASS